jgi:hypothetical protein
METNLHGREDGSDDEVVIFFGRRAMMRWSSSLDV